MLSAEQFFGFLLAASVITVAPGPDNMMVLSIGMAKGRLPASPSAWVVHSAA